MVCLSYFTGILWFMVSDIKTSDPSSILYDEEESFNRQYELDD